MAEPLPIDDVLDRVLQGLRDHSSLVLTAAPGAGKTTRVPGAIFDAEPKRGAVWVLEPRRLAARLAARRVAEERRSEVGREVGYEVRFERRVSKDTRISFLTEGLLNRKLVESPELDGVGTVILDEIHERSVHADLAMMFLSEIRATIRPDLWIVAMSATLETGPIAHYLGATDVSSEGRSYPLTISHDERPDDRRLEERVVSAIRRVFQDERDDGGDILVFLPGAREIHQARNAVAEWVGDRAEVHVLYGELDPRQQDVALSRGRRRKIVLSTNVAETSLTIPGVTCVIDSGLVKVNRHDPGRGMDALVLSKISRASAQQRAGRAGRTAPGRVYRLWTEAEHRQMSAFEEPEIRRVDLSRVVLDVLSFSPRDPLENPWLEPPPVAHVSSALELLRALGAVTPKDHKLTRRGKDLVELPVHPRVGTVLLAARELGVGRRGALAAAILGERDFIRGATKSPTSQSDVLDRIELAEELEAGGFRDNLADRMGVDAGLVRSVCRARDQLLRILGKAGSSEGSDGRLLEAILAGYADRVGRRRPRSDRVVLVGGRGAKLRPECAVREAELLVAIDVEDRPGQPESQIRIASAISRDDLETLGLQRLQRARWNAEREAAEGVIELRYRDLLIEEKTDPKPDGEALSTLLAEEASKEPERSLALSDKAEAWLERIAFVRRMMPDLGVPEVRLQDLIVVMARGCRSLDELRKADPMGAIREVLGGFRSVVDAQAPEKLQVPTGSMIAIRYDADGPKLAVRLQEVFGWARTPTICGGRAPVTLELLSPGYRPVQVTRDLASFWNGTYQEVRRELRARYPKHSWPEDPWTAPPVRKGRSSKS